MSVAGLQRQLSCSSPLSKLIITLKLFPPTSCLINTHVQTHVSSHILITTSGSHVCQSFESDKERGKERRPGANKRNVGNTLSTLSTPFSSFPPNELWVSELMNGRPVNNGHVVISVLAHSSWVILGNFRLGLNQWH